MTDCRRWTIREVLVGSAGPYIHAQLEVVGPNPHPDGVEVMPVGEHEALRNAAEVVFDAAGNGDEALGMALVDLGLVLAGEEPNG